MAYDNHYWWINECNRVLEDGGIIVWKMQDTISGSIFHNFIEFESWELITLEVEIFLER